MATVWILVQGLLATHGAHIRKANPCGPCVCCSGQKPGRGTCVSSGGGVGSTRTASKEGSLGKPKGTGGIQRLWHIAHDLHQRAGQVFGAVARSSP